MSSGRPAIPLATAAMLIAIRALLSTRFVLGTLAWLPFVLAIGVFLLAQELFQRGQRLQRHRLALANAEQRHFRALGEHRTPLFLYLLVPFQFVGGLNVWTTRLPNALGGVACVLLTWYLGARWFGRPVGARLGS